MQRVAIERERGWRERLFSWPWRPWKRWSQMFLFEPPFTLSARRDAYCITVPREGPSVFDHIRFD